MNCIDKQSTPRFVSLRTKLIGFISLIIIVICSILGLYFIRQRAELMDRFLSDAGTILAKNLAYNSRTHVFIENLEELQKLIDGVMEVEEVVYVVITGSDGKLLAAKSKGLLADGRRLTRAPETSLYPSPEIARTALASASGEPIITPFIMGVKGARDVRGNRGKAGLFFVPGDAESLDDFAVPVLRRSLPQSVLPPFLFESPAPSSPSKVYGVVQVGITRVKMLTTLNALVQQAVLITVLIILCGIALTIALARHIITPLKSLAGVAERIAEGDLSASLRPTTDDEVGQLTEVFNRMAGSLKERDESISSHIRTITKQVGELSALNKISTAITTTLNLDKLLGTILHLLTENVGFSRARLVLYDDDRRIAFGSRMAGVPEEVDRAWRDVEVPIQDDGSLLAELLLHGRPVLIEDINAIERRLTPFSLVPARQLGIISYVCAPLKSKERILGYVAAARGEQRCTEEDLNLLVTIASEVAVALDNARAYHQLEQLTRTLEQRVRERTRELQNANERLRELDELKSVFVSTVSHELRTPMTSIKGYVDNILDGLTGLLTEKQSYYLTRVKYNVERLTRMINDLLDLSRIEAGKVELHLGSVCLRDLANDVVEGVQQMAREKGVALHVRHPDTLPPVRGERDKLHQILTNLLQNAVKFTPKGGRVEVESLVRDDGFVQISVSDTGCGIPPHELARVFDRFYRGEAVPTEDRGSGLGLPIAKSLVDLHGGRIWAESTIGQGSRFFFTVPIESSPPTRL
nr:HAMP domain-containing protein [Nitrospirota bacterium]